MSFISVLQPISPELIKDHPSYIPKAREGQLLLNGALHSSIDAVYLGSEYVAFEREPMEKGGRLVKVHGSNLQVEPSQGNTVSVKQVLTFEKDIQLFLSPVGARFMCALEPKKAYRLSALKHEVTSNGKSIRRFWSITATELNNEVLELERLFKLQ